jgi:hypothetical protein
MICSAYVRKITPLELKKEMESWLMSCEFQYKIYILAYLKKHTKQPTIGSVYSVNDIDIDMNILTIVFTVCYINIDSPNLTDETRVFAFPPRGTRDMIVIPRLAPIILPSTQSKFEELGGIGYQNNPENIRRWVGYYL